MTDQPDETSQYLESSVRRLPAAPAEIVPYATKEVVPAPSGVARGGGNFLGSLTKLSALLMVGTVVITGIANGEYTPGGMIGATYAAIQTAFRNGSADADALAELKLENAKVDARLRAEANEPWAKTQGVARAVCNGGMRVTNGRGDDFWSGLTQFACAVAGTGGY